MVGWQHLGTGGLVWGETWGGTGDLGWDRGPGVGSGVGLGEEKYSADCIVSWRPAIINNLFLMNFKISV